MADDQAEREARAKRLREQIDNVVKQNESGAEEKPSGKAENPRDFINRRMQELDKENKG